MVKHTPGPWTLSKVENMSKVPVMEVSAPRHSNYWIAKVMTTANNDEELSNAHLIAAAPELLQALKDCVEVMEDLGNCKQERFRALDAIAKAEGIAQ